MTDIRKAKEVLESLESAISLLGCEGFAADCVPMTLLEAELKRRTGELRNLEERVDIRTVAMIEANKDGGSPYSYPHATRREMVDFLLRHEIYETSEGDVSIGWSTAVSVPKGLIHDGPYVLDSEFDDRWDEVVKKEGRQILNEARQTALERFTSGTYRAAGDAANLSATFELRGKANNLVLYSFQHEDVYMGQAVRPTHYLLTQSAENFEDWMRDDVKIDQLVCLYNLVRSVDGDIANLAMDVTREITSMRAAKEQEWANEAGFRP